MDTIRGVVEGLAPVRETVSDRSSADFETLQSEIDAVLDCLEVTNYTFYLRGSTNGIRSSLPFLTNHPTSANVLSDNRIFTRLINHLHSRGVTVGAIVEVHRFDSATWGSEAIWSGSGSEDPSRSHRILAAADQPVYRRRLRMLLHEVLRLFPELDYLFLEGEPYAADVLSRPLAAWLGEKGLRFEGATSELTYDDEVVRTTKALGIPLDLTWSTEGLAFAVEIARSLLAAAEETFADADWTGQRGLVYSAEGPECRSVPVAVPRKGWWLLPRVRQPGEPSPRAAAQRRALAQHLIRMGSEGRRLCCLVEGAGGDVGKVANSLDPADVARAHLDGLLVAERSPGIGESSADRIRRLRRAGLDASS